MILSYMDLYSDNSLDFFLLYLCHSKEKMHNVRQVARFIIEKLRFPHITSRIVQFECLFLHLKH